MEGLVYWKKSNQRVKRKLGKLGNLRSSKYPSSTPFIDTEHSDVEEDEVEDDDMEELVEPCDEMTLPQFQASSKK
ncbi:hypothetical protein DsansV1_C27g0202261 [Dioscorea sansibarensis]